MTSATVGFKFMPTKQELLFYLRKKMMGEPLPWDGIQEKTLYGEESPWELFNENDHWVAIDDADDDSSAKFKRHVVYCFTILRKIAPTTGRKNLVRICGRGTWKGGSNYRAFSNGGIMKTFKFKKRPGSSLDANAPNDQWSMCQYSLSSKFLEEMKPQFPQYVICKITRRVEKRVSGNQDDCPRTRLSTEVVPELDLNKQEKRICSSIVEEESKNSYDGAETEEVTDLGEESTGDKKTEDFVSADESAI